MRKILTSATLCFLIPLAARAAVEGPRSQPADRLSEWSQAAKPQMKAQTCNPECPPEESPFSCQETDYGINPSLAGTLFFSYYGDVVAVYNDYCSNGSWLVEYWCNSSSSWTTTNFLCTNGCSSGRCL